MDRALQKCVEQQNSVTLVYKERRLTGFKLFIYNYL